MKYYNYCLLSFMLVGITSCCVIPRPVASDYITASISANDVTQYVAADVIYSSTNRNKGRLVIMQLLDTKYPIVINRENIYAIGGQGYIMPPKLYIGKKAKWESVDVETISSRNVVLLEFKWKNAKGNSIRIVEKNINDKGDSIIMKVRIPANQEERDLFYKSGYDKSMNIRHLIDDIIKEN